MKKQTNRKKKARGKRPRRPDHQEAGRQEAGGGDDDITPQSTAAAGVVRGWGKRQTLLVAAIALIVAIAVVLWLEMRGPGGADGAGVRVPILSAAAEAGRAAFGERCAACHGATAGGTDKGPPLVHAIYRPGHHADGSIVRAIRQGTRAHHWPFGDMPPQPDVTDAEVPAIIAYVRELQRANGIN